MKQETSTNQIVQVSEEIDVFVQIDNVKLYLLHDTVVITYKMQNNEYDFFVYGTAETEPRSIALGDDNITSVDVCRENDTIHILILQNEKRIEIRYKVPQYNLINATSKSKKHQFDCC